MAKENDLKKQLIHKKVRFTKTGAIGTIINITYNKIFIKFEDKKMILPYPSSFNKSLEVVEEEPVPVIPDKADSSKNPGSVPEAELAADIDKQGADYLKAEQEILDDLIEEMDQELLCLDQKMDYASLQIKKAKDACLPDTYSMLISAQQDKIKTGDDKYKLKSSRKELYQTRIEIDITDFDGQKEKRDLKIGLHSYLSVIKKTPLIISWKMPVCRHYLLDNSAVDYYGRSTLNGESCETHYALKLKRNIDIEFDKVKSVQHLYPLGEETADRIIADEFLQELLKRKTDNEFKNIVFSIQKQQGEIIQVPFERNLIIQGCAGSGKSMIMLHRLPVVLYDNARDIDRKDIFIITPSQSYIQLASNMMEDLEIEDLPMGTIRDYYDHLIRKYHHEPDEYGIVDSDAVVTSEQETYIYSDECIQDIRKYMEDALKGNRLNLSRAGNKLGIASDITEDDWPQALLRHEILRIQKLINEHDAVIRRYRTLLKESLDGMKRIQDSMQHYRERLLKVIGSRAEALPFTESEIYADEELDALETWAARIGRFMLLFEGFASAGEDESALYEFVLMKSELVGLYDRMHSELLRMSLPYDGCDPRLIKIKELVDSYDQAMRSLDSYNRKWLTARELDVMRYALKRYDDLVNSLPLDTYKFLMGRLGYGENEKGQLQAIPDSPYLFSQILCQFQGAHSDAKDSLITIDEAQNLTPNELQLMSTANGGSCVFNLFGDVRQHVEGSRGIENWSEFETILPFSKYEINANYRNTRQITEYCNKSFGLEMAPVSLDGEAVHVYNSLSRFGKELVRAVTEDETGENGSACIIVKNKKEATWVRDLLSEHAERLQDLTDTHENINPDKWNLMTVSQTKGLEFSTVFVLSWKMTENESYIAYTRALNKLYVYRNSDDYDYNEEDSFAVERGKDLDYSDAAEDCVSDGDTAVLEHGISIFNAYPERKSSLLAMREALRVSMVKTAWVVVAGKKTDEQHFQPALRKLKNGKLRCALYTESYQKYFNDNDQPIFVKLEDWMRYMVTSDRLDSVLIRSDPDTGCVIDRNIVKNILMNKDIPAKRVNFAVGDITKFDVECVVNSTDETLLSEEGLSGAIHKAAGSELAEACRELGGCEPGEAKLTEGFGLYADYIIHTAAPVYFGSPDDAETLKKCYRNSMELAKDKGITTIAFPPISTGLAGFPSDQAAEIAAQTIYTWIMDNDQCPMSILVVSRDEQTNEIYRKAFFECSDEKVKPQEKDKEFHLDKNGDNGYIVLQLIKYMEKAGLSFSSINPESKPAYGILEGKTGVGYRKEGIVLYCARDGIDKDRLFTQMKKPVFPNSESTRPYKIVLSEEEFPEAVRILLQNEYNR